MGQVKTNQKIFVSYPDDSDLLSLDIATAITSILLTTEVTSGTRCGRNKDASKARYPIELQVSSKDQHQYISFWRGQGFSKLHLAQVKIIYHQKQLCAVKDQHHRQSALIANLIARTIQYIEGTQFQILLKTDQELIS